MKKKILAALMAVVMLFTILPLGTLDTAWAEERASATASEGSISGGKLLEGYLYRLAGMDIRSYENGFNSSSMAATYSAKANLNAERLQHAEGGDREDRQRPAQGHQHQDHRRAGLTGLRRQGVARPAVGPALRAVLA